MFSVGSDNRLKISTELQHLRKPIGLVNNEIKSQPNKITNTEKSQNINQFYDITLFKAP